MHHSDAIFCVKWDGYFKLGIHGELNTMRQGYEAEHPFQVHFVKGLLEAKGIASEVRHEDMIGGYPSVWVVADTDFELAQELVSALSRGQAIADSQSDSWCCPKCREQIEVQFTECWQCGALIIAKG